MSRYENVHFRAWLLKHPKMKKENKKKISFKLANPEQPVSSPEKMSVRRL